MTRHVFTYSIQAMEINRFGEEISEMDEKIDDLKREFVGVAKDMFSKIETNLTAHLKKTDTLVKNINVADHYISLGGKRIVSVGRSKDKNDVVIRDELAEVKKVTKFIVPKKSEVSGVKDTLEIQNNRRISSVSQGVLPYDVIVKSQLDEVSSRVNSLETVVKQFKENAKEDINELSRQQPPIT